MVVMGPTHRFVAVIVIVVIIVVVIIVVVVIVAILLIVVIIIIIVIIIVIIAIITCYPISLSASSLACFFHKRFDITYKINSA